MPLSDTKIRKLKPLEVDKKYSDGEGLYLLVTTRGSKLWRMRYYFDRKEKLLSFGKYPHVSLSKARERRAEARKLLAEGVDPRAVEREMKARKEVISADTFSAVAAEFMEKLELEGKAKATLEKKRWLLQMAEADFGNLPITKITTAQILDTLRKLEARGIHSSAHRLRSTISQVFRHAIWTLRAEGDPTIALKGALASVKEKHVPAVTDRNGFEEVVKKAWGYDGSPSVSAALKLSILLYPRPGELRLARWQEFDLRAKVWTIPPEHEKNDRRHTKPLSDFAIEILGEHLEYSGSGELVFPSVSNFKRPLSENAVNQALIRLKLKGVQCAHGFRSSASSIINESGDWHPDAVEAELCHMDRNQVRRAYNRALYWEERVRMAAWWAEQVAEFLGPERR